MLVLDASSAVDFLLSVGASERIEKRVGRPGETMHAPHVIDLEVIQTLRRLVRSGQVSRDRSSAVLEDLADLPLTRYSHVALADRIWELRENVSAFDGAYVALAEALDAPLVTSDAALARAPGTRARIEVYR